MITLYNFIVILSLKFFRMISRFYMWTVLENHISLLPTFKQRSLSYAQTHFWMFLKLLYPRFLCFDYGLACIPTVDNYTDVRYSYVITLCYL